MKNITKRLILFGTMLFMLPALMFASETGVLKGKVVDAQTGEPLLAATVSIKLTGTVTNLDGDYYLSNIPVGTSTVTVSYVGYQPQNVEITLTAKEVKNVDFKLDILATKMGDVIVTTQMLGQRQAINEQLKSDLIMNAVSAEKMQELPDANAAEAIGRLPGISLQRDAGEANKVVVRGLSPKYVNVTLEGVKMPSTDMNDRSVDLSMVQTESLSGVEVSKSLRPDMDADAIGGTVNLRLAKAPDVPKGRLAIEESYSALNSGTQNYKVSGGASDRFFKKQLGVDLSFGAESKMLPNQQMKGGYSAPIHTPTLTSQYQYYYMITDKLDLTDITQQRDRANASLLLDYNNDWYSVKFINMVEQKKDFVVTRDNVFNFYAGQGLGNNEYALNLSDDK